MKRNLWDCDDLDASLYTAPPGRIIISMELDETAGEIVVTLDNLTTARVVVSRPHGVTLQ